MRIDSPPRMDRSTSPFCACFRRTGRSRADTVSNGILLDDGEGDHDEEQRAAVPIVLQDRPGDEAR